MSQPSFTTVLGCLFVILAVTGYSASASANAASDCRQEAKEYGIVDEGLDDYIDGCLASRGEPNDAYTEDTGSVPPAEADDLTDQQTGDNDAPQ